MHVKINGEWKEIPDSMTIQNLINTLGIHMHAMAVAVNEQVVPKNEWNSTTLKEGDRIEIIRVVAGG